MWDCWDLHLRCLIVGLWTVHSPVPADWALWLMLVLSPRLVILFCSSATSQPASNSFSSSSWERRVSLTSWLKTWSKALWWWAIGNHEFQVDWLLAPLKWLLEEGEQQVERLISERLDRSQRTLYTVQISYSQPSSREWPSVFGNLKNVFCWLIKSHSFQECNPALSCLSRLPRQFPRPEQPNLWWGGKVNRKDISQKFSEF